MDRNDLNRDDVTNRDLANRDGLTNRDEVLADSRTVDADGHEHAKAGDLVGEGVGGLSGIAAGAALGSLGGPLGTIIGGVAGAIGGWWAGRSVSEAASGFTDHDDEYYRKDFDTRYSASSTTDSDLAKNTARTNAVSSYDDARPVYQLGTIAGANPDYSNRSFDEVEPDLRRGYEASEYGKTRSWNDVRDYARDAYTRRQGSFTGSDREVGVERGAEKVGDATRDVAHDIGDATRRGANKVVDAVDNVKDRVDGNPASKPGPDATDRRF